MRVFQVFQARRQPSRADERRGGDTQGAFGQLFGVCQLSFDHRHLGEEFIGGIIQQLAFLGQDQAARMAVEQGDADAFLKRADLARDGRLAQVQGFARVGETACFGNRVEDSQFVPVHFLSFFMAGRRRIIPPPVHANRSFHVPRGSGRPLGPPYSPCPPLSRPDGRFYPSHRPPHRHPGYWSRSNPAR